MKVCPICKAIAFDDATRCYGCLHQFKTPYAESAFPPSEQQTSETGARSKTAAHREIEKQEASPFTECEATVKAPEADGDPSLPKEPTPCENASRQGFSFLITIMPAEKNLDTAGWSCSIKPLAVAEPSRLPC